VSWLELWIGVGALGGLGAIARFLLDGALSSAVSARFPLGTLIVNLSGTLLLGLLVGAAVHGHAYLLAGTATLGSYTTFSTWMFESHRSGEDGRGAALLANILLSLVLGLAAVTIGHAIG
jgi:CrcB protein